MYSSSMLAGERTFPEKMTPGNIIALAEKKNPLQAAGFEEKFYRFSLTV